MSADDPQAACRREIEALHVFFEDWFCGRVDDTDEVFARAADALAPGFELVTTDGRALDRDTALTGIRKAHGADRPDGLKIWTADVRGRPADDGLHIVTYEEWQTRHAVTRGRLSTALFAVHDGDDRPKWLHVHETWLPQTTS
jgi:hypothetical protein